VPGIVSYSNIKTIPHELGHTLGLRHIDKTSEGRIEPIFYFCGLYVNPDYRGPKPLNPDNVMISVYNPLGNIVQPDQINAIVERFNKGELNIK